MMKESNLAWIKKPFPFPRLLLPLKSMWIINLWAIKGKNWNKLYSGSLSSSEHLQRDLNGKGQVSLEGLRVESQKIVRQI